MELKELIAKWRGEAAKAVERNRGELDHAIGAWNGRSPLTQN